MRAVTVYCSSSSHVDTVYFAAASELGRAIAGSGWRLVYGGNHVGCMAALADGARNAGGKVTGITPQLLVDQGMGDPDCDELIITSSMRDRKGLLEERADGFVTLPGGIGTFEEVFEIIVGRVLGYHSKPIVLLNVADYYAPLLAMIDHGIETRFIRPATRQAFFVATTVAQAIAFLKSGSNADQEAITPGDDPQ